jgi:hypothetical protein
MQVQYTEPGSNFGGLASLFAMILREVVNKTAKNIGVCFMTFSRSMPARRLSPNYTNPA